MIRQKFSRLMMINEIWIKEYNSARKSGRKKRKERHIFMTNCLILKSYEILSVIKERHQRHPPTHWMRVCLCRFVFLLTKQKKGKKTRDSRKIIKFLFAALFFFQYIHTFLKKGDASWDIIYGWYFTCTREEAAIHFYQMTFYLW